MGDGAGIMLQIPDKFFAEALADGLIFPQRRVRYWYGFFA